jgi:fumarate reductase subunit D
MLKLEPIIWSLFGAGMFVGSLLLPAWLLVVGILAPMGIVSASAVSYDHVYALASHPIGRLVFLAAIALPLWAGAHQLRHIFLDFGGLHRDGLIGGVLYGIAAVGSVLAIVAVVNL